MYNLVLLLMGVIVFTSFKNNKKILLKNIFIQKDVDLNSKKQCEIIFPFEYRAISSPCCFLPKFMSFPSWQVSLGYGVGTSKASTRKSFTREGVEHTLSLFLCCPDTLASLPT